MDEKDFPSSSDENDEDFVPEGEPSSNEGSSPAHSEDNSDDDKGHIPRKRRKISKKKSNKVKNDEINEENAKKDEKVTDVDALWADFKEDVNKMEKKIVSNQIKIEDKPNPDSSNEKNVESKSESENAGGIGNKRRNIPMSMGSGSKLGLNKILSQIGKKDKMSTLAKSKLDWINFKKNEGIEEEIKTHNKGKDGYLEKQDFLERTDLRQFEIEKKLRTSKRHL